MSSVIRCKVRCWSVVEHKDAQEEKYAEAVSLAAVVGEPGTENDSWSKATPSAQFTLWISNPGAFGKLESGKEYLVDFTPAE